MRIINFIINSNLYIALAAVLLTIETQLQLGMEPSLNKYLFLIFFATLFDYNVNKYISISKNPIVLEEEKYLWIKDNREIFHFLTLLSTLGFVITSFSIEKKILIMLLPLGIITLFYSLPIYKNKNKSFRLREIPGLKIFLIAGVWSATTILLPFISSKNAYNTWHILILFIERFILIFAIALPFDIRDIDTDKKTGLKTIPIIIGEKKSILIATIYLLIFLFLTIVHYYNSSLAFLLPAFIISAITSIAIIHNKKISKLPYYHYFILDGMLLLQGILTLTCYYLIKPIL